MDHRHRPTTSSEPRGLEAIEGLGPRLSGILREAGISSIAELSDFQSSEELHRYLVAHGVNVPMARIANARGQKGGWVGQARSRSPRTWVVDFRANRTSDTPTWTTTVSSEELAVEERFDGLDPAGWAAWVLAQSAVPWSGEPERKELPTRDERPGSAPHQAHIEVEIVDVDAPEPGCEPRRDSIEAQIKVELSGPAPSRRPADSYFIRADLVAVGEDDGRTAVLASVTERLGRLAGRRPLTMRCQIPSVGRHRLWCLAIAFVPDPIFGCAEGPILTVLQQRSTSSQPGSHR